MYESQIAHLRELLKVVEQAQEVYLADPPAVPGGILIGTDLSSAAARIKGVLNHFEFLERTAKANGKSVFALARPARA